MLYTRNVTGRPLQRQNASTADVRCQSATAILHIISAVYVLHGSAPQITSKSARVRKVAPQDDDAVPFDDITLSGLLGKGRCRPHPWLLFKAGFLGSCLVSTVAANDAFASAFICRKLNHMRKTHRSSIIRE